MAFYQILTPLRLKGRTLRPSETPVELAEHDVIGLPASVLRRVEAPAPAAPEPATEPAPESAPEPTGRGHKK